MSSHPRAIVKLVGESGVGFNNAKTHTEIKEKITARGYNDVKLDALLDLNGRLDRKYHEYEVKHGEQLEVTRQLEEIFQVEMDHYSLHRKMAFHVFPGDQYKGIRSQLGIDEKHKDSFDGFIEQAKQFYDTAQKKPEILAGMAEFAVSSETLQERLDALEAMRRLNEVQESKKGEAKIARKERDDLYYELRDEWSKFRTVCLFVFKNNPEYLKILNIEPYAKRTAKTNTETQGDQTDPVNPPDQA